MLTLTLKQHPTVPLEAEKLSPDVIASLSLDEVRALPVHLGKHVRRVDEFFDVVGEPGDTVEIRGDLSRVKWIGHAMTRGSIKVVGNAGMHLGSQMKGGTIEVTGNAGDWIGAEMTGGFIRVLGNAGGQIGAAYRGGLTGMNGGTIIVDGTAGLEIGMRMKRGIIVVGGLARDFVGLQMKGGTIILLSGAEIRTGAWMFRGTIVSLKPIRLLPTFNRACAYEPTFLRMYAKHLHTLGVTIPLGGYERYLGDAAVPGHGELLVWGGGA